MFLFFVSSFRTHRNKHINTLGLRDAAQHHICMVVRLQGIKGHAAKFRGKNKHTNACSEVTKSHLFKSWTVRVVRPSSAYKNILYSVSLTGIPVVSLYSLIACASCSMNNTKRAGLKGHP